MQGIQLFAGFLFIGLTVCLTEVHGQSQRRCNQVGGEIRINDSTCRGATPWKIVNETSEYRTECRCSLLLWRVRFCRKCKNEDATTTISPTTEAPATEGPPPTTVAPEQPTTIAPEQPTTIAPEQPTTIAPEQPTTIAPEQPTTTVVPEQPTTVAPVTEQPTTAAPPPAKRQEATTETPNAPTSPATPGPPAIPTLPPIPGR